MKAFVILCVYFVCVLVGDSASHTVTKTQYFPEFAYSPLELLSVDRLVFNLTDSVQWSISPTVLSVSGQTVTVIISGISSPSSDDYLAAYSPPPADLTSYSTSIPIKLIPLSSTRSYTSTGSSTLYFNLVNQRSPYSFAIYSGKFDKPKIISIAPLHVNFTNYNQPTGIHLSLSQSSSSVSVTWTTGIYPTPPKPEQGPQVRYGIFKGGPYTDIAYPEVGSDYISFNYTQSQMCGGRAKGLGWRAPGNFHSVTLRNLILDQDYYYIVGDSISGYSQELRMKTIPSQDLKGSVTNVIVYGDMGQEPKDGSKEVDLQPSARNTAKFVAQTIIGNASTDPNKKIEVDLVMHIGDISYARGYSCLWDEFMHDIQSIASTIPYMTCIGNHEMDWPGSNSLWQGEDSMGECGIPYGVRFHSNFLNQTSKPNTNPYWYSYDLGTAHYIMMSTEHNFSINSEQWEFIRSDLEIAFERKMAGEISWIILAGHRPMYIDSTNWTPPAGDQPVAQLLRQEIEVPLMRKYQVDLALWGHHHSYQRTCVVYQEECVDGKGEFGTVHVVVGTGGQGLSTNIDYFPPGYFLFVEDTYYGFMTMTVSKEEILFQFVRDTDGAIVDQWALSNTGKGNVVIDKNVTYENKK